MRKCQVTCNTKKINMGLTSCPDTVPIDLTFASFDLKMSDDRLLYCALVVNEL